MNILRIGFFRTSESILKPFFFFNFRILQCPIEPLKDIVNILRYELQPELVAKANFKWNCRICLTVPSPAPPIMPLGQPGLLKLKDKMLLFLQFSR